MRIMITGAAGFIGHHVLREILDCTLHDVVCLDRLDFSGTLIRIDAVVQPHERKRVKIVHHDLKAAINPLVATQIGQIDVIIHMAAQTHVDRSIAHPMDFVMDNVVGTVNLLEFARTRHIHKFLYFSTDEVFGPAPSGVAYKEYDRYNSGNPYAATKAAAEELVTAYHNTYKVPAIITHTMNVFGYRQHPEKFIPTIIRKIIYRDEISVHANKDLTKASSRFYIHANDVAEAIMTILMAPVPMDGLIAKYNIVGETETFNDDLVNMIGSILEVPARYKFVDYHSSRPGHDLRYALDGTKMKEEFGWTPRPIKESLRDCVMWYLRNPEWYSL